MRYVNGCATPYLQPGRRMNLFQRLFCSRLHPDRKDEADRLMNECGEQAFIIAYQRSRDQSLANEERQAWYELRAIIAERLGYPDRGPE